MLLCHSLIRSGQKKMLSSSWVYRLSCVLRVLCLFSPGYIHPDEFFQGGQVSYLVHDF